MSCATEKDSLLLCLKIEESDTFIVPNSLIKHFPTSLLHMLTICLTSLGKTDKCYNLKFRQK